jgi:four helix bundle protein
MGLNGDMGSYKQVAAWQYALEVSKQIHQATDLYPLRRKASLSNQMERAAVSIMSNIAEGWYRPTKKDWRHFMRIAYGSAAELESQLILSHELGYIQKSPFDQMMDLLDQIQRLLNHYTQKKS